MSRRLILAGARLGPIRKPERREADISRMAGLMEKAVQRGAEVVVFPELALTTFCPRCHHEDPAEPAAWCETAMPSNATAPLFEAARQIMAQATSREDAVITAECDLDPCGRAARPCLRAGPHDYPYVPGRTTTFDFARHRRPEHYTRITA